MWSGPLSWEGWSPVWGLGLGSILTGVLVLITVFFIVLSAVEGSTLRRPVSWEGGL